MSTYFDIVPHCKLKFMLGDAKVSIEWTVEEIHVGTNSKNTLSATVLVPTRYSQGGWI